MKNTAIRIASVKREQTARDAILFLGVVFFASGIAEARLITIPAKPKTATQESHEALSQEYRFADTYIDTLAHVFNAETYTDEMLQKSKAWEANPDSSSLDFLSDQMTLLKESNRELDDGMAILRTFEKNKNGEIRKSSSITIEILKGLKSQQSQAIEEIKKLLDSNPSAVKVSQHVDAITSVGVQEHRYKNYLLQSSMSFLYATCKAPKTKDGHYDEFNFSPAQRARLESALLGYFGESVKELKAGGFYSEGAAATVYKILTDSKIKDLDAGSGG